MKRVKFKAGRDADRMLLRKLLKNFIVQGKITTTKKKAKYVRSSIERVVGYAKNGSQATQNKLRSALDDRKVEDLLKSQVAPVFKDKTSGFTKIVYLQQRVSDASEMARLEWSMPVVMEVKKVEPKVKTVEKTTEAKSAKPVAKPAAKKTVKKVAKPAKK